MTAETPEAYNFNARDRALLAVAAILLTKVATAKMTRPAELVSVAKLQHVLSRLPRVTRGINVVVHVEGPRRKFGQIETRHSWDVAVENGLLSILNDGYFFQPSTGGDSFISMEWSAAPGKPAKFNDYRERLAIVPDVRSFPDAVEIIDFASGAFAVEVMDPDNPLLEDVHDAREETSPTGAELLGGNQENMKTECSEPPLQTWSVLPVDDAERGLAATINSAEVDGNDPKYVYDVEKCDFCGSSLAKRGMFVDGCVRGKTTWGNMCAQCCESKGEGVRWGSGQLYARQPNGDWRIVGGFQPKESS
jgi:hypothetical protein